MRLSFSACLAVILSMVSCASAPARVAPSEALVLRVAGFDDAASVVTFQATNVSSEPIAVVEAFGFDFLYFNLEIVTESRQPIEVSKWELTKESKTRCLASNESLSFRIPLRSWNPVHGTDATCKEEHCSSYPLAPGAYRFRAVYRPPSWTELRHRCARVDDIVVSDWLPLVVK